MVDFFRTQFLTIILTFYGLFYTDEPYYMLFTAGLLLVVFTIENLSEERNVLIIFVKVVLVLFLCILSKGFLLFLLFGQSGYKRTSFVVPPVVYLVFKVFCNAGSLLDVLPLIIVQAAVLFIISVLIWHIQVIIEKYTDYKNKVENSIKQLAVSGLAEKKLNHMLIMQNNIIERNARLEERENISRNIHNSVGHTITAASMALEAAGMLWETDPLRAADKTRVANERIKTGLESIRHAVRVLDEETENISIDDFKMDLEAVIDNFKMDTGIKVYFGIEVMGQDLQIPHEHTEFLTGAASELLTNGVKHGNADIFTIWLQADSTHIKVSVKDNGKSSFNSGNAPQKIENGFGIKKIIKYVQKAGGKTVFKNDNGFYAEIMMPVAYLENKKGD